MNQENKIKSIVDQEIDTEILFKHKDLELVQKEIGKAEAQLTALKKLSEAQTGTKTSTSSQEPTEFATKYTKLLSILSNGGVQKRKQETVYSPVSSGYMTTRSQANSLRPVARMRPSTNVVEYKYQQENKCICRRSDNVLVALNCPKCNKADFLSTQGFINHCRIAHQIDILSHDHAAMTCGTLLPKEEQDDDGLSALENLEKHGLDPRVNLNKDDLEEYAKSNKSDPLASKMPKFEKPKSPGGTSPHSATSPGGSGGGVGKKKPAKFKPKYGHLKQMCSDVEGFEKLVSSATELLSDSSGDEANAEADQ